MIGSTTLAPGQHTTGTLIRIITANTTNVANATGTDSSGTRATANASATVTVICIPPPPTPVSKGFMTGGGRIEAPFKLTFGYVVHSDPNDLPNNIQINWKTNGVQHSFHLTKLTSAYCFYNASLGSPNPPKANFNTWVGDGIGRLDGIAGATIHAVFTDQGQPAKGSNPLIITIASPTGEIVLNVNTFLRNGAQQAHKK